MHRPQTTGKRIPITQWCKSMLAVCIGARDEEPQTNSRTIDTPFDPVAIRTAGNDLSQFIRAEPSPNTPSELFASLERRDVRPTLQATVGQEIYSLCEDTGRVISHQITRVEGDQAFYSVQCHNGVDSLPAYEGEYFTSVGRLVAAKLEWINEEIEACEGIARNLRAIRCVSPGKLPIVEDPASPIPSTSNAKRRSGGL